MKKKMNFYNTYDFRLESAVNILQRWDCLKEDKGLLFVGEGDLEKVPDVLDKNSENLVKNQQMKLLDLLNLIKTEDRTSFLNFLKEYFGESNL